MVESVPLVLELVLLLGLALRLLVPPLVPPLLPLLVPLLLPLLAPLLVPLLLPLLVLSGRTGRRLRRTWETAHSRAPQQPKLGRVIIMGLLVF